MGITEQFTSGVSQKDTGATDGAPVNDSVLASHNLALHVHDLRKDRELQSSPASRPAIEQQSIAAPSFARKTESSEHYQEVSRTTAEGTGVSRDVVSPKSHNMHRFSVPTERQASPQAPMQTAERSGSAAVFADANTIVDSHTPAKRTAVAHRTSQTTDRSYIAPPTTIAKLADNSCHSTMESTHREMNHIKQSDNSRSESGRCIFPDQNAEHSQPRENATHARYERQEPDATYRELKNENAKKEKKKIANIFQNDHQSGVSESSNLHITPNQDTSTRPKDKNSSPQFASANSPQLEAGSTPHSLDTNSPRSFDGAARSANRRPLPDSTDGTAIKRSHANTNLDVVDQIARAQRHLVTDAADKHQHLSSDKHQPTRYFIQDKTRRLGYLSDRLVQQLSDRMRSPSVKASIDKTPHTIFETLKDRQVKDCVIRFIELVQNKTLPSTQTDGIKKIVRLADDIGPDFLLAMKRRLQQTPDGKTPNFNGFDGKRTLALTTMIRLIVKELAEPRPNPIKQAQLNLIDAVKRMIVKAVEATAAKAQKRNEAKTTMIGCEIKTHQIGRGQTTDTVRQPIRKLVDAQPTVRIAPGKTSADVRLAPDSDTKTSLRQRPEDARLKVPQLCTKCGALTAGSVCPACRLPNQENTNGQKRRLPLSLGSKVKPGRCAVQAKTEPMPQTSRSA